MSKLRKFCCYECSYRATCFENFALPVENCFKEDSVLALVVFDIFSPFQEFKKAPEWQSEINELVEYDSTRPC